MIIGNKNSVACKEIFPLLENNETWLGYCIPKDFVVPTGGLSNKLGGLTRWFTNLDISKRHEDLILFKRYREDPSFYPKYDNYDAINVDKVKYIPEDYDGVMGVPITFLDIYNPEQFEIIGAGCGWNGGSSLITKEYSINQLQFDKNGCKQVSKLNDGTPLIKLDKAPDDKTYYTDDGEGYYYRTYSRIFIRNLHPLIPQP